MRNDAIDFDNLITRPGLSCLWVSTAEAEATHLTAQWIEPQKETREPFSTFDASGQFFPENSSTYGFARLVWALALSQVQG